MPTRIFRNEINPPHPQEYGMSPYLKMFGIVALCAGSFVIGWVTSTRGYHVAGADGHPLTRSNAAQIVKAENSRLAQEVVGMTEQQAEGLMAANDRTFFVAVRDGKAHENPARKTFTNLTVEVKDGKVARVLGWY